MFNRIRFSIRADTIGTLGASPASKSIVMLRDVTANFFNLLFSGKVMTGTSA